jgi:hypothetical protein
VGFLEIFIATTGLIAKKKLVKLSHGGKNVQTQQQKIFKPSNKKYLNPATKNI